jgi:hypothetical protein
LAEENHDTDDCLLEFEETEVAGKEANGLKGEADEVKESECDAGDCLMWVWGRCDWEGSQWTKSEADEVKESRCTRSFRLLSQKL